MTTKKIARVVTNLQKGVDVEVNFRRLFESYHGSVHGFFKQRGCSAEDSLDLTQETFLRVYQNLASYRGEASFDTWLFGVVMHVYRNSLRSRRAPKRSAQVTFSLDTIDEPKDAERDDPLEATLHHEHVSLLKKAIDELPPRTRRVLILSVLGFKKQEIADVLGLTPSAVKSQLYRGRKRLLERF